MTEVQRATTMQAWLYAARSCVHIVEKLEAACIVLLSQIRRVSELERNPHVNLQFSCQRVHRSLSLRSAQPAVAPKE